MSDLGAKIETCQWPNCGNTSTIIYLDSGLCDKHWCKICDMGPEKARKKLRIKECTKIELEPLNIISFESLPDIEEEKDE